jgi:hypothetical protein
MTLPDPPHPKSGMLAERLRRGQYQQRLLAPRTALGQDAFEAAWAEGPAMTREQALESALAEA